MTKRDIFHYVYGLLHSPQYRERYKENLKRELPRVPLVENDPEYIARLVRKVVWVSVETVKLVAKLPAIMPDDAG